MRKLFCISAIGLCSVLFAQVPVEQKKVHLKANALLLPIGIVNAGAEFQLSNKYTLQGDVLISPWKSFDGKKALALLVGVEPRYYFKEAYKGFFIGGNLTLAAYSLQKWSYWKDTPVIDIETGEPYGYLMSDLYQEGFSFIFGATVGYQFRLNDRWNMEIFAGAGNSQGFYKGYNKKTGERYDKADGFNRSGEWLPYRGGIMLVYKLK